MLLVLFAIAGCRATGLPAPPPGEDPADPEAAIPPWTPADNPLERSAFGKDEPAGRTGHEGHGHHHDHSEAEPQPQPDTAPDNAPPSRPTDDEHHDHGTPEAQPK